MNRTNQGIWLTAALSAAVFAVGCGSTMETDAGTGCTTDSNCATGKGCHPILKQCVDSCTSSSDCPASQKTCAKISNSTTTFCTCSTDAICAMAVPGNVCNEATKQCTAKCTATSQCPSGFTCNTTSGNCTAGTGVDGGADAGTDAGVTDAGTDAGMTDAGVTCNNTNQPDVCGYGDVCDINNVCQTVVDGTCSNVSGRTPWNSASTGPVIYRIDDESPDDTMTMSSNPVALCGAGTVGYTVTIYAYAPAGVPFSATKSGLPGFFYYATNGTTTDIPGMLLESARYMTYANNTVMSARFTLCSSNTSGINAAFGFTNGNAVCKALTHN